MKVYKYENDYRYYDDDKVVGIIVAESESVALGLLLENYETSKRDDWTINEIDISKHLVDEL